MSEFDEQEFYDFLTADRLAEETQERLALIALRGEQFLTERGVQFPPVDGFAHAWFDDDEGVAAYLETQQASKETELGRELTEAEAEEVLNQFAEAVRQAFAERRTLDENKTRLTYLARLIAQSEVSQVGDEQIPAEELTRHKKRLQARYKVEGAVSAWQELVDAELPGESLGEADGDIVEEVALQYFEVYMDAETRLGELRRAIECTLAEEGVQELTNEEMVAVILLANRRSLAPVGDTSWQEEAQLILINQGLPITDAWVKVIAQLVP